MIIVQIEKANIESLFISNSQTPEYSAINIPVMKKNNICKNGTCLKYLIRDLKNRFFKILRGKKPNGYLHAKVLKNNRKIKKIFIKMLNFISFREKKLITF